MMILGVNLSFALATMITFVFLIITIYRLISQRKVILPKRAEFEIFTIVGVLGALSIGLWLYYFCHHYFYFPVLPSGAIGFIGGYLGLFLLGSMVKNNRIRRMERFEDQFPHLDDDGVIYVATVNGRGRAHFIVDGVQQSFDVYTSSEEYDVGEKVSIVNINNGIMTVIKKNEH